VQPARAAGALLGACRRRAGPTADRALRRLRRRPSLWAVAMLLALYAAPAAGGRAAPATAAAVGRVETADLPERSTAMRPPRERHHQRPPGVAATRGRPRPPWPLLGNDTSDHLLVRALAEIRRRDPARYRQMRRQAPRWGLSLCDPVMCDRDVQGQTLRTSDGECLSSIDVAATLGAARRSGIPGLPWLAGVLVHEHAHCHNLRNEYSSLAAQRAFLDAWPAGPARERARRYVRRLYGLLDASGNWSGR